MSIKERNKQIRDLRARIDNDTISQKELREWLLNAAPGEVERIADPGLRHKSGASHWDSTLWMLKISRPLAYATEDDSWGEFEKLFSIIFRKMIEAEKKK